MTAPIHTTFGFSIYLFSLQKCRIHQMISFGIGINTRTGPIDKELTIRIMMDCILTSLIAFIVSLRASGETGHLKLQC